MSDLPNEEQVEDDKPVDGRRAWRDRNRLAVVDALLDLYAEGNMRPGAQEVAERSGVSRRSVFRYFEDLDDLDRNAVRRQLERVWHLIEIPEMGKGPLEERIEKLANQRAQLIQTVLPAGRVMRLRSPFNAVMKEELEQNRRQLRRQAELQFEPELNQMDAATREEVLWGIDIAAQFETSEFLLSRGLSLEAVQSILRRTITGLIESGLASSTRE